jgi:integrase
MATARTNGLIFPGARPDKPVTDVGMAAVIRRMGRDVTTHGFRSTFRTWAGERTNFAREIAEKALAHTVGDETERAYDRGDLFEKRRRLMDAWDGYAGASTGTIVPLNRRAS